MSYQWGKKRPSETSGPCVYCGKPRATQVYSVKMKTFIHKKCVSEIDKATHSGTGNPSMAAQLYFCNGAKK